MEKLVSFEGLAVTQTELKKYIDKQIEDSIAETVVQEDSFLKFPVVGKKDALYIDTTTNKSYRFDEERLKYYIIGTDYEDIKVIRGNF